MTSLAKWGVCVCNGPCYISTSYDYVPEHVLYKKAFKTFKNNYSFESLD